MDAEQARAMARHLMDTHGLQAWHLRFDRAKRRAGTCRHETRTLTLSKPLVVLYDEARVREVVLHEIAHALCGPEHGHDAVWRATARRIGSTGRRTIDADAPRPSAPWVGVCPAGHTLERYRRPTRVLSCGVCARTFDPAHQLQWTFHGEPVPIEEVVRRSSPPRRRPRPRRTRREVRWRRP